MRVSGFFGLSVGGVGLMIMAMWVALQNYPINESYAESAKLESAVALMNECERTGLPQWELTERADVP
jgi:hypothetical protein